MVLYTSIGTAGVDNGVCDLAAIKNCRDEAAVNNHARIAMCNQSSCAYSESIDIAGDTSSRSGVESRKSYIGVQT